MKKDVFRRKSNHSRKWTTCENKFQQEKEDVSVAMYIPFALYVMTDRKFDLLQSIKKSALNQINLNECKSQQI